MALDIDNLKVGDFIIRTGCTYRSDGLFNGQTYVISKVDYKENRVFIKGCLNGDGKYGWCSKYFDLVKKAIKTHEIWM